MRAAVVFLLSSSSLVAAGNSPLVERVGTGFLQLEAERFKALPAQEVNPQVLTKITGFTRLFWAHRGNHNEMTAQRFLPEFTCDELKAAVQPPLRAEVDAQRASLFDAALEPLMTAKSPQGGRDILPSSANHFYSGASMADLKGFTEKYPLNSLLVKDKSGKLVEQEWRACTPDGKTPAGMYAGYLKKTNEYLERDYAEAGQAAAIAALIRYGYVKQQLGYSAMYGVK